MNSEAVTATCNVVMWKVYSCVVKDTRLLGFLRQVELPTASKWTHDAITTSLLRQNAAAASFWRNNDVSFVSCVRWDIGYTFNPK